MNGYLRQSTAGQVRAIGPFLDDTDFKTAETALTILNTDVKLTLNGGTFQNKNSGGGTHRVNGMYSLTWNATDTASAGELAYAVVVAGALPVFGSYVVLEEVVYDALYAAGATGYAGATDVGAIKAKTDQLTFTVPNVVTANATHWASVAVAATDSPGYPKVTIKDGVGPGEIALTNGIVEGVGTVTGDIQGDILGDVQGDIQALSPETAIKIWSVLETAITTAGSIGVKLKGITLSVPNLVDVNLHRMKGLASGVDALDRAARDIVLGTVGIGATVSSIPTSSLVPTSVVADQFRTRIVIFDKDTATVALRGQAKDIVASSAGGTLTVTALTTAPVAGDTFVIL